MIVVSVDPRTGKVAFISLPRDMSGIPLPRDWPAYRAYGGKYNEQDQHALHDRPSVAACSPAVTASAATRPSWARSASSTD